MMKQRDLQTTSSAKAIAIDPREQLAKLRLIQLLSLISGAVTILGLHLIFAR
ncbi:MAG TPA: hypothetical protein VNE61_00925 [Ktedonobacteraceae bacterium]|nr:hypothetical protein [Ktedonobacteraceae bacterium]